MEPEEPQTHTITEVAEAMTAVGLTHPCKWSMLIKVAEGGRTISYISAVQIAGTTFSQETQSRIDDEAHHPPLPADISASWDAAFAEGWIPDPTISTVEVVYPLGNAEQAAEQEANGQNIAFQISGETP